MADRIPIREVVVVEGRYDKIALSSVLDAHIVTTEGFAVFNSGEKRELLRRLGEAHGIIVLTDSDAGGRQIRSYLSGILPKDKIRHLYIPEIPGKEKRKKERSRGGLLGVEGMDADTLRRVFAPLAADAPPKTGRELTKTDLYERGLLGGENASAKRERILSAMGLPGMTPNAFLSCINLLGGEEVLEKYPF